MVGYGKSRHFQRIKEQTKYLRLWIDFLTIILLIFGVLQIILFFKVWGMTNDIKDIRNKYLKDEDEKQRKNTEYDAITKISGGSKPTI
jgi:hypothetical protein